MPPVYIGIDVGAVSVSVAALDEAGRLVATSYRRTLAQPHAALRQAFGDLADGPHDWDVAGAGVTGSGRRLVAELCGADVVKNEITTHYVGARLSVPDVATIIDIGGQDSKVILVRDGVVVDFAMNTICGAGTGSFLDQQAARLGIPVERLGDVARTSRSPVEIRGGCGIFAESEAIHFQQRGARIEDIVAGLCRAVARNFLRTVARGKELREPVVFEGGVAANVGVRDALSRLLGVEVIVPDHHTAIGAIGAAVLARGRMDRARAPTQFRGIQPAALADPASHTIRA